MAEWSDPTAVQGDTARVEEHVAVLVVGAGPAGLAAAIAAAELGVQVMLVDEHPVEPELIGLDVPYHFGQRGDGSERNRSRALEQIVESDPAIAEAFERGVDVRLGVSVFGAYAEGPTVGWLPGPVVGLTDGTRSWLVGFDRLIVAAGRRDLGLAFPGWEKPGVIGIAALHALATRYRAFGGRRVLVLGSSAEALVAALDAHRAGIEVAALIEVASTPQGPRELAGAVAAVGIPILTSTVILSADGPPDGVTSVRIAALPADGSPEPVPGSEQAIACDTVVIGVAAVPNVEIFDVLGCHIEYRGERGGHVPVRDDALRTSLPFVYAAGDAAGVTAAGAADPGRAAAEGRAAALHAALSLGAIDEGAFAQRRPNLPADPAPGDHDIDRRLDAWTRPLVAAGGLDVVVCQCEEVTRRDLLGMRPPAYLDRSAPRLADRSLDTLLGDGPVSQDQVKRLTRAGMGPCQGRRCREQVSALLAYGGAGPIAKAPLPSYRPPLRPIPLGVLQDAGETAAVKDRWVTWFAIPGQWTPYWEIGRPSDGDDRTAIAGK